MTLPFLLTCSPPYLVARFPAPQRMLSWAIDKPGFQVAERVAWREVRNADLSPGEDPLVTLARLMADADLADAVTLVTSRDITRHHLRQATVDGETATCLATVGLSNGERVGVRCREPVRLPGTINLLVHVARPLTDAALVEMLSIATEARTAAVLDAQVVRGGLKVTGTGTDCIVAAAPVGGNEARFAGLHTAIGEAVGHAVYHAMEEGIAVWQGDFTALTGADAAAE